MTTTFPHRLDRTLVIKARPQTVFEFFNDSAHWATWWGSGSTIDARPGGQVLIRHPNGVEVAGEVLDVSRPQRLVFTYGYVSGRPIPAGSSRVTIRLDPHPQGTLLQLTHEFSEAAHRDAHVQGWRFQLSLFANAIATAAVGDGTDLVDRWFTTWNSADRERRNRDLEALVSPTIRFEDKYSCLAGREDLFAHVAAIHQNMPGLRLERRGVARRSQWTMIVDWAALNAGDEVRATGTNVFTFDADRKIESVVGFWN
jgi:uncharacterized protein YndB with AHSA1/START domain